MKRLCIVCGARVVNTNPKTDTCDTICSVAKVGNISRERAGRMLAAGGDHWWQDCLPVEKKTNEYDEAPSI